MRRDIYQLTDLLKDKISVKSFIEIGSRDGHDTNYIKHYWDIKYEDCYIIEAHPDCYNFIVQAYPLYQTLNIAASNVTGQTSFNAGIVGREENIGVSSLLDRTLDTFVSKKITVDAWRMDEVMQYLQINSFDLAKVDVEGAALQVLQGFGEKISLFKAIQIELETSQVWEGQSYYIDVVKYLDRHGFKILDEVQLDAYQKDVLFINHLHG
jgi:FkbM family methyltransferase